ncbi:hypothetical protein [Algoriphagus sp. Y33]|uniref:hypothetical protein n=1 Tax=Algoriphagus sp. Y33 TaxID=2772483 RepID=UPI001784EF55|nr:hypothetical protein [Algoriphagus sp. Y33]
MKLEYDHRHLSIAQLHNEGIRSPKELEEVVEWKYSHCNQDDSSFEFPVYIFTGLTDKCKGIKVVLTFDESGRFVTLDAKAALRDELFKLVSGK